MRRYQGFTLIEIIVVVVILSTLASMSLVGYHTLVERQLERRIVTNLDMMMSAIQMRLIKTGEDYIFNLDLEDHLDGLSEINDALGTNIVADTDTVYECWGSTNDPDINECRATSKYGWIVHAHFDSVSEEGETTPHCFDNNDCPTCERIPLQGTKGCR